MTAVTVLVLMRRESSTQNPIKNVTCSDVLDLIAPRITLNRPSLVNLEMF